MEIVTVSSKGQISIPKEIRERLNIREGTRLVLSVKQDTIIMSRDRQGWRDLRGLMAGSDLLKDHMDEKRQDLEREQ